jgi:hypothetical protein
MRILRPVRLASLPTVRLLAPDSVVPEQLQATMITYRTPRAPRTDACARTSFAAAIPRREKCAVQNKANFPNQFLGNVKTCMPIYGLKSPDSAGNPDTLIYDVAPMTASQRVDSPTRSANFSSPAEIR